MAEFSRERLFSAVAVNQCLIGFSLLSTPQSPRRTLDSVCVAAHKKIVQRFDFELDADAAPEFAGSAAVGAQSVALVEQGIIQLLKFYRRVLHIALTHRH